MSEILFQGGRKETLRQLEALPEDSGTLAQSRLISIKRKIRFRLGVEDYPPEPNRFADRAYSDTTRARLRQVLRAGIPVGVDRIQFEEAFEWLTVHDPGSIVTFLMTMGTRPSEVQWVYGLASYFASRCVKDRAARLKELLTSHDPYARVAGAVYLAFESEKDGREALRVLTALEGDPGVWAALTLARRGDKSAMLRALEVLRERGAYTMEGTPHRTLQRRVVELLSNSAEASGIGLPIEWNPDFADQEKDTFPVFEEYSSWWRANVDRITLYDPWFDRLAAKKID